MRGFLTTGKSSLFRLLGMATNALRQVQAERRRRVFDCLFPNGRGRLCRDAARNPGGWLQHGQGEYVQRHQPGNHLQRGLHGSVGCGQSLLLRPGVCQIVGGHSCGHRHVAAQLTRHAHHHVRHHVQLHQVHQRRQHDSVQRLPRLEPLRRPYGPGCARRHSELSGHGSLHLTSAASWSRTLSEPRQRSR